MLRKMPWILLAVIFFVSLLGDQISPAYQSILLAISLSIKSLIISVLPFVIFGLLFKTAVSFASKASKMILLIFAAICGSNFLSTLLSYNVGTLLYTFDVSMSLPTSEHVLLPAWEWSAPKWIGNDQALLSGLALGLVIGWTKPSLALKIGSFLDMGVNGILKAILCTIPLFLAGFIVKMAHEHVIGAIFHHYLAVFVMITSAVFTYIGLIYLVVNRCQLQETFQSLKNMAAAAIAGFGSMSSAAAMPLTILGVEKNSRNPVLASCIIPSTVNIHLIGDCFAIPIFAFAVMKSFGVAEPSFFTYLIFASYFVLAKFSVAAVPGGGILVMLPILEQYLGFQGEMLSLITALYILFDPVITCANVLGNGGFALVIDRANGTTAQEDASALELLDKSL